MSGCEGDEPCDDSCPEQHSTLVKEVIAELFGDAVVDIKNITKEQRKNLREALRKRGIRPCMKCVDNVTAVKGD